MEDVQTPEGVEAYVASKHREIAENGSVEPVAWLWVKRAPDGTQLERLGVIRILCPRGTQMDAMIAGIRQVALTQRAVGVCFVVPMLELDDVPLNGPAGLEHGIFKLAFLVEHMSEKVGKRFWTASVAVESDPPEVGPLVYHPEGVVALGGLGELLPQRGMN